MALLFYKTHFGGMAVIEADTIEEAKKLARIGNGTERFFEKTVLNSPLVRPYWPSQERASEPKTTPKRTSHRTPNLLPKPAPRG